jgi:hypothetical protein
MIGLLTFDPGRVILDGVPCGCKRTHETLLSDTATKSGLCTSEDEFRPFRFSTLTLTGEFAKALLSINIY